MKTKNSAGSVIVFMLDMISVVVSFIGASYLWNYIDALRGGKTGQYVDIEYGLGVFVIAFLLVSIFFRSEEKFLQRNKIDELFHSAEYNLLLLATVSTMMYLLKTTDEMSRGATGITVLFNLILDLIIREIYRKLYFKRLGTSKVSQMVVITTSDRVDELLDRLLASRDWGRRISGVCILDDERQGEYVHGIKVVANYYDIIEYMQQVISDEVYINVPYGSGQYTKEFITKLEEMGAKVYLNIDVRDANGSESGKIEYMQGMPVISYEARTFGWNQLFVKRMIDILGSLVGIVITIVITPFVAIPLLIESPGPLIFKQKRVGRNGRFFYIYKFRSMYKDAEARKAALMEQNEMKGLMFKMTDDPRITKVGKFIRKTSIDELPQFFNVLKGDMSLVGTRPPTVDEFKEYTPYHKRRLSLKPGITGMWQVSGRSDIEDFEEVVRLDLQYIDNWKPTLDIKILLKTVLVVFKHEGSR